MAALCRNTPTAWSALGWIGYSRKSSEEGNVQFRQMLYFVENLRMGDLVILDAVHSVRPSYGLPPKLLATALGRRITRDEAANTFATNNAVRGV